MIHWSVYHTRIQAQSLCSQSPRKIWMSYRWALRYGSTRVCSRHRITLHKNTREGITNILCSHNKTKRHNNTSLGFHGEWWCSDTIEVSRTMKSSHLRAQCTHFNYSLWSITPTSTRSPFTIQSHRNVCIASRGFYSRDAWFEVKSLYHTFWRILSIHRNHLSRNIPR